MLMKVPCPARWKAGKNTNMFQTFTLRNGLKVATFSIPQMRSISLNMEVKSGSLFDTPATNGIAHYMEHLLVQGIPFLPDVTAFSNYIEGFAGSYGASTGSEGIDFNMHGPVGKIDDILRISSEVFFQPLFPPDAIERERGAIKEEIRARQDELGFKLSKFYRQARYRKGHPVLLDIGGEISAVESLTRADLLKFWARFFTPANTHLVMVGGFNNSEAKKLIKQYFGNYEKGPAFIGYPKLTNSDYTPRSISINYDSKLKSCYVDLSFASLIGESAIEDRVSQAMIGNILGRLRSSRLYKLLRQQKGLVYTVGAGQSSYRTFGNFYVTTEVTKDKLDEVLDLIIKELVGMYLHGPTTEELEFAKNYSINKTLMSWDHPSNIAGWIMSDLMWEDKNETPEEHVKIVQKVTVEDTIKLMRKHWDFKKLIMVIQGPVQNSKANRDKFAKMLDDLK